MRMWGFSDDYLKTCYDAQSKPYKYIYIFAMNFDMGVISKPNPSRLNVFI